MMLLKSLLTLLKNLNFVFKFCILMNNLILMLNKLLQMFLSVKSFPNLEVFVKIIAVFCCKCVSHSFKNVVFIVFKVLPKLKSKELVVHVPWEHSSQNSKFIITLIHPREGLDFLFIIFSLRPLNSKLLSSSLKLFIMDIKLKGVKTSPNQMIISLIWNLIHHFFSSSKELVLHNFFAFAFPLGVPFKNSVINFCLNNKLPSVKNFLSKSGVEDNLLKLFYSLIFFFFLNHEYPLR